MSAHNIAVDGGKSVRLPTAGKYCDRDIVVTATGVAGGIVPESKEWQQTPTLVQAYLDEVDYNPADYSASRIKDYAPSVYSTDNSLPVGASVSVPAGELARDGYGQTVTAGMVTLYNDEPMRPTPYTVREGATVKAVGTLRPSSRLRQIKSGYASNVRDLGGWTCDGGTVKYGKLFRGGKVTSADREVMVNQLGIRHDLDLRGASNEGLTSSPLGDEVGYTVVNGDAIQFTIRAGADVWKQFLRCVFDCVKNDDPVYIHCAMGRDRTGSVACIIEALLGMSQSDIDKDYELTCFADNANSANYALRTKATWGGSSGGLISMINALTVGSTFSAKVINWVASLGFTAQEIADFRAAMIDGTPSAISYAVTKTASANCSINGGSSVLVGAAYTATVTVDEGYTLSAVTVTMGGVDVTTTAVSGNTITIPSVTGDVVISAVATAVEVPDEPEQPDPATINQIPLAVDADGNPYNGGKGYKTDYRLKGSSGAEEASTGTDITGFIPVKYGDTVYLENIKGDSQFIQFHSAVKNSNAAIGYNVLAGKSYSQIGITLDGSRVSFVVNSNLDDRLTNDVTNGVAFIRVYAKEITDASIVNVVSPA